MPVHRYIALTCLLLALPAQAGGLLQAYTAAQAHDPGLAAAEAARRAALEAHPQALATLLPQLEAHASLLHERYKLDDQQNVLDDISNPLDSTADHAFSAERREYALTLRQPLLDVAAFLRLSQASVALAQAQANWHAAQQQQMLEVAKAYFRVLAAQDTLTINQAERSAYADLVDQARKRLQTGLGARIGVEEADAFYTLTEQAVLDARLALDDAREALTSLTGQAETIAALRDDIPLQTPEPAQVEAWLTAANQDNPELRAARLNADLAQREIKVMRARQLPTIELQAALGRNDTPDVLGGNQRIDRVGLSATLPLFSGGQVRSQVRQAAALSDQATAQAEELARRTARLTLAAFREVMRGIRVIQANRRSVEANRVALHASRNGLEAGTRTEFDLLNAQNNYYAAQRAAQQARYDYLYAGLRLKALAGRLDGQDLIAIDALLIQAHRDIQP